MAIRSRCADVRASALGWPRRAAAWVDGSFQLGPFTAVGVCWGAGVCSMVIVAGRLGRMFRRGFFDRLDKAYWRLALRRLSASALAVLAAIQDRPDVEEFDLEPSSPGCWELLQKGLVVAVRDHSEFGVFRLSGPVRRLLGRHPEVVREACLVEIDLVLEARAQMRRARRLNESMPNGPWV